MAYTIDNNSCIACGDCQNYCPVDGAIVPGDIYRVDPSLCIDCDLCSETCPTASIYRIRIAETA